MCLVVDDKVTAKLSKKAVVIGYKLFICCENSVVRSGYFGVRLQLKRGWDISNRKSKKQGTTVIHRGIHVFLKRSVCDMECATYNRDGGSYFVVPVKCYRKDLVAGGLWGDNHHSAVYMKVKITKKDIDKACVHFRKVKP